MDKITMFGGSQPMIEDSSLGEQGDGQWRQEGHKRPVPTQVNVIIQPYPTVETAHGKRMQKGISNISHHI